MGVLYALESIRTPALDKIMSVITLLGGELFFMVIAVTVFWCVSKREGYYLMIVGFFGTVINQFLKILCCVPRPWIKDPDFTIVESARAEATGYSFPSGHTQNAVATYGGIARYTRRGWLRAVLVVLTVLIAFSRMYLGVHTPLDVGVSFLIAAVLVLAYAGCCVAANALYSHTAFPNTSVLGMDVSGLSAQEAEQRWTEQGSALLDGMTIRLTRDGQEIGSTTLSDLGVTVLPVYVSKAAGCDVQDRGWGSDVTAFLRGGWRFIESWFRAVDVTPQLDVDEAKLTAACEQLSDTVGCTVTDGGYRLAEGDVRHPAGGGDGRGAAGRDAGRGGAARRVGAALREPRPVRGSPVRGMCVRGPHRRAHGRAGAPRRDRRHHGRCHL